MGGRLFDWLGAGAAASRPAAAAMPALLVSPGATAFYYSTDTKILGIFDESGPSWFDLDVNALAALTPETIQDMIAGFLTNGAGISLTYNDVGNLLVIASTITQYTDEMAQDAIAAAIAAGTHVAITPTYNDAGNWIGFAIVEASSADMWAGSSSAKVVTPKKLKDMNTPVSVADAATITLDGTTGRNFYTTLGGNRAFPNPTNFLPGQQGVWKLTQDGTGSRVPTFGSNWKAASKSATGGVLSTAAGAVDSLHYYVQDDGIISYFIVRGITTAPAVLKFIDLGDVDMISTPPTNGQVPVWDSGSNKWKAGAGGGGGTGLTRGQILALANGFTLS
jgi:hypothetical protein